MNTKVSYSEKFFFVQNSDSKYNGLRNIDFFWLDDLVDRDRPKTSIIDNILYNI